MDFNKIFLVCAALCPAVVLCVYIFKKDRVEKEPIRLLLLLLGLGALSCYPAAEIEGIMSDIIVSIFEPYTFEYDGQLVLVGNMFKIYNAVKYFIGVGLVEEGLKWLILILVTRKNKNFNSLFDGIIYAVFVSLGFAGLENIFYVLRYGFGNAVMRAVTSVPGHMFFGVLMGYYYSMWHMHDLARTGERALKKAGFIPSGAKEFSITRFLVLSIVIPILAHGLYDYCCTVGTTLATFIFYYFVGFLYVYCFYKIKKMSKYDMSDKKFSNRLLYSKYPHLAQHIKLINEVAKGSSKAEEKTPV